jgi:thymidylate synthase (FAD)
MKVRLLTKTEGAKGTEYEGKNIDEIIVGIARLSSSRETNELFEEPHKLLRHCLNHSHWSVFATANLGFEITTSRAIGRELLRHWSLAPQELSQRYKAVSEFEPIEIRMQSTNNRQSSTEIFDPVMPYNYLTVNGCNEKFTASEAIDDVLKNTKLTYLSLIEAGVAKECARMILPETTETVLIFNGKIRDWITTLNQRLHKTAQKECRLVAEAVRDIFIQECPVISKMLYNFEDAYHCHVLERVLLEKYGVYEMVKANNFKKIK